MDHTLTLETIKEKDRKGLPLGKFSSQSFYIHFNSPMTLLAIKTSTNTTPALPEVKE